MGKVKNRNLISGSGIRSDTICYKKEERTILSSRYSYMKVVSAISETWARFGRFVQQILKIPRKKPAKL